MILCLKRLTILVFIYSISFNSKAPIQDELFIRPWKSKKLTIEDRAIKELEIFNIALRKYEPDLFVLAMQESSRMDLGDTVPNYEAHNVYGYIGAWQIGVQYLESLGIPKLTLVEFIEDPSRFPPELQLIAVKRLIKKNLMYLRGYENYLGSYVMGIEVTRTGIIYAAHLGGAGGTARFLKYGYNPSDAFGGTIAYYMNYENTFAYKLN